MRWFLSAVFFLPVLVAGQSNFSFSGYTAGRNYTAHAYTFSNTQNGYTMTARVTQSANPGWMNVTGATSPNYATWTPTGCSESVTGLYLATDRSSVSTTVSLQLSFAPAVCGPVTFRIYDINGEDVDAFLGYGFRDDVTISAFDQNNTQIALSTAMVTSNGSGNCGGGSYGASYVHTTGNSLRVVGCTYDNCYWDYFTISSATRMISRIVIDYASGNRDWYGSTISNPNRQWIIVADVRAWTPAMNITTNCGTNPVQLFGSITSAFPPSSGNWGIPNASYPSVPVANRPGAATFNWTGTAGTFGTPTSMSTTVSGLSAAGGSFTLTGQNNRGCVATRTYDLTIANCAMLPVELVNFLGRCENGKRYFDWSTASELNNHHFVLEQSEDGRSFTALAEIPGAGYSQQLLHYEKEVWGGGGNYFRLKQVDGDGSFTYSDIIRVDCVPVDEISMYPNPASDLLTVEAWQYTGRSVEVILRDVTGRVMLHENRNVDGASALTFNLSGLAAGVYHAAILDKQAQVLIANKKIVKL